MSLQQAIDILQRIHQYETTCYGWGYDFERGFKRAIRALRQELEKSGSSISTSPDTQYKKNLTAWIEAKRQAENPYSIFEAWQIATKPQEHEPMFKLPDSWKGLTLEQKQSFNVALMDSVKVVHPIDHEEGEG